MKILRLKLRNFRGVGELEVRFRPRGVTIVQGPNEVGKSSLAESISVLFEHLDSTSKREVKAIKPVHRDEGAEIEVDVETGLYAFTYFKRFHKRTETRLRIDRPRPENLTGREAHERADAILRETVDVALWKALRIEQGAELTGPNLTQQTRLSTALDTAAGSTRSGEREDSLFEGSRTEYLRFFTETGKERKETTELEDGIRAARERSDHLELQLRALDEDVQRSARLRREVDALERREPELAAQLKDHDTKLEDLARLETDLQEARARAAEASALASIASQVVAQRQQLVQQVARLADDHAKVLGELELASPELARAARELNAIEDVAQLAKAAHARAETLTTLRRKDQTFLREQLDLEQLRERDARVEQARTAIVDAETSLAGPRMTDKVIADLQAAVLVVERERASLKARSPYVRLEAHVDLAAQLDGLPLALRAGDMSEITVERSLALDIPGVAALQVSAGGSADERRAALELAEGVLARLLATSGVSDFVGAIAIRDAQRDADAIIRQQKVVLKDALRDLTPEALHAKVASLSERVGRYPLQRSADVPLPADSAEAKRLETDAELESADLQQKLDAAVACRDAASKQAHDLKVAQAEIRGSANLLQEALALAKTQLEAARATHGDEAIATAQHEADARANSKQNDVTTLAARVTAVSPDEIRMRATNARKVATDERARLNVVRVELAQVTGRLQQSGEEGLAETRDKTVADCSRFERELTRVRAHAAAAKLLYDALTAARSEARAAYVAPLRNQIERLGRLVFNSTLRVDLDESLAIVSRTLDGVTVPFESLSGGTREQLGLLVRLSCAILVAEDGGAPVILDDTLGYTDAERLDGMGVALASAGENCQVIVLTCMPDRYRQVGGADVVRLG